MKQAARTQLVEARKRRHWTQQEVADHLGTTQHNVSRWERGKTTPGSYFRAKLCDLFCTSAQELGLVLDQGSEEQPVAQPPLRSADHPPSLWQLPYPRNPHFTGRDDLLDQLDWHLAPRRPDHPTATQRAALTQPQAIKGLGGIGKTQIAVEYAYRAREQGRYTHTLWINAGSAEAIMTSFVTLAELLPAFPAKAETDQHKLVAAVKRWLEQCQQSWLLIFDNADDLSLVQEYMPQQGNGSILLTTRANAVGSLATPVEVESMSFLEGTQLLLRRAQRLARASEEEINEAGNIVVALDHFPLALDQAGAYIEETGCSFSDYLHLYQAHRSALLARRGTQATQYPDSVATTWSLSFQKVEHANPAAADLLRVCAFLAPDHIPEELLTSGAPYWTPVLQQAAGDAFTFNQMLEEVLKFSLVKRLTKANLIGMHRLVQVVLRERLDPAEQRQWAERVVCAVNAAFPPHPKEEVATWPTCLRYLEQAQACDALIQHHELRLPEAADLLDRTGLYLREHAFYTLAEPLFQRALAIREQVLEPDHLQVATLLNNLGGLYFRQGKFTQADPLFQRVLHLREQVLGPDHLQVAYALHNLAALYKDQGKYAQAYPLLQRALQIEERQLGPEHLQITLLLGSLASLSQEQGEYRDAEQLYQRALRIRERHLGPTHLQVATLLNNLANVYLKQEKYMQAEPLYQRALQIREEQLGPQHPLVASPLSGLAHLFTEQGKYAEAEALLQRALMLREQAVGPQHPDTADILHQFATLHQAQGNPREAAALYHQVLMVREQVFGAKHAKTVETRAKYRELLRGLAREARAAPRTRTGSG